MDVRKLLQREEGFKSHAYYCTEGYPTIGIGWKIGRRGQPLEDFEYITIDEDTARTQMTKNILGITLKIEGLLPEFKSLSEPRKAVLISMGYQLGVTGLFKFKKMIQAIIDQDWDKAYSEGLDSRWANQTRERACRQMITLKRGDWSEYE